MELSSKEPEIGEAFGQILAQCWAAGAAPWSAVEIIERDDGRIDAHDASPYFSEPERWAVLERWAWERAGGGSSTWAAAVAATRSRGPSEGSTSWVWTPLRAR